MNDKNSTKRYTTSKKWNAMRSKCSRIYYFGAGVRAKRYYEYFFSDIDGFIVSSHDDNPDRLFGKSVLTMDELEQSDKDRSMIILTYPWKIQKEIYDLLIANGYKNIISVFEAHLEGSCEEKEEWEKRFGNIDDIRSSIPNKVLSVQELEKIVRIYTVKSAHDLHKYEIPIMYSFEKTIQAGASCGIDIGADYLDNTNENVSYDNPQLCEISAAYWVAKNDIKHKYVGLFHYGRKMDINPSILSYIIENDYDIVLPHPLTFHGIIRLIFNTEKEVLDILNEFQTYYPDEVDCFLEFINGFSYSIGNIMIAKREVYRDYIGWIMDKLQCHRKNAILQGRELYPRELAYLAENLTNVYLIINRDQLKIGYVNIKA